MKKILVIGSGMVGGAMAADLSEKYAVTAADKNESQLNSIKKHNNNIDTCILDVTDTEALCSCLKNFDFVVCAVPGFLGFATLETIIKCGKSVADISFFPEDALQLNSLAVKNKVTAIVDCGVAPGLSNLYFGYFDKKYKAKSLECYVGGLPVKREPPFEYKAPFSPIDVIEEYLRPARIQSGSKVVIKAALSEIELLDFEETGTLEAFNTDGLRSLLHTMNHVPDMIEKTMRYPGHAALMKIFRDTGYFNHDPINVKGTMVKPIDITSKLLFEKWKYLPGEEDLTIMKLVIKTENKTLSFLLYDKYDKESNTSSMARTTGYTCTASLNLIIENKFNQHGVFPPEIVGQNESCFTYINNYLNERNVVIKQLT